MTDLQVDITTRIWAFFLNLTCELSQNLLDGDTAGVRVPMGTVGGDQVIGGVDGSLDTCSTRFLYVKEDSALEQPVGGAFPPAAGAYFRVLKPKRRRLTCPSYR